MVNDHTARWMSTDPGDGYPPDAARRLDSIGWYPGPDPWGCRSGFSPSGGAVAQLVGNEIQIRDSGGKIYPTDSPYPGASGGYTFILAAQTFTLAPAHATLPRTDLLVARLQDGPIDGSGNRRAIAVLIEGTPGGAAPDPGPADLPIATYASSAGGQTPPVQTLAGIYTAALGGAITVQTESQLPTEGAYSGMLAYVQSGRALWIYRAGTWRPYISEPMQTVTNFQPGVYQFASTGAFSAVAASGDYQHCQVTFTTGASGMVHVSFAGALAKAGGASSTSRIAPEIRTGATPGSGSIVIAAADADFIGLTAGAAGDSTTPSIRYGTTMIAQLSPFTTYNCRLLHRGSSSNNGAADRRRLTVSEA